MIKEMEKKQNKKEERRELEGERREIIRLFESELMKVNKAQPYGSVNSCLREGRLST